MVGGVRVAAAGRRRRPRQRRQHWEPAAVGRESVAVIGDAAIVCHLYESESETDGKPNSVRIGALQVWQKQDGNWKLLARQGFKMV